MTINLEKLSVAELQELRTNIDTTIVAREEEERKQALEAARKAVEEYGYSLEDLTGTGGTKKSAGKKRPAKYANPENPDQQWSGRGRQPQWFKDALAEGKSPELMEL